VEDYEDQLVIARMVLPRRGAVGFHGVGFVLGKHYLLTVQERSKSMIALNRCGRAFYNKGALRAGFPTPAYTLLDSIIDGFFPSQPMGERLGLRGGSGSQPNTPDTTKNLSPGGNCWHLRRAIWPQRDAINFRDGSDLSDEVQVYLRDCYDHAIKF